MSSSFEMCVAITGCDAAKLGAITSACTDTWPFDTASVGDSGTECTLCGEGMLAGNRTAGDFTDRLAAIIWAANEGFCEVVVTSTFLELLPCEEHTRGKDHYEAWATDNKKESQK